MSTEAVPADTVIEAWQTKGFHQNTLLVQHVRYRDSAVCDENVDLMQHWELLHMLYQHGRDAVDVFAVVKANALGLCYLFCQCSWCQQYVYAAVIHTGTLRLLQASGNMLLSIRGF